MPRDKGDETARGQDSWTRSTAACNGCRQRKQKCGGEKPVCVRCHTLNQTCVWRKQQKRGPAKGYIEALEARLYETETVLLRILSAISVEQVSSILTSEPEHIRTNNVAGNFAENPPTVTSTKTTGEQRRLILQFWNQFPLGSPADVSRWHSARQFDGGGRQIDSGIKSRSLESDESITISSDNNAMMESIAEEVYDNDATAESNQGYHDAMLIDINDGEYKNQTYGEGNQAYQRQKYIIDCEVSIQGERRLGASGIIDAGPTVPISTETNRFGLSKEFREAFLW